MRSTHAVFLLLAAALLLNACKKPEPSPPTPKTVAAQPVTDSCAVLTPAEISATLGVPIDPGMHTLASSDIMCNWRQTGSAPTAEPKLVLNFSSVAVFDREKGASGNVKVTPAPGIGDDAFYVTTEFGTSLLIRKGTTSIGFSIHEQTSADSASHGRREAPRSRSRRAPVTYLRLSASNSSSVRGQSLPSSRDKLRSARTFPSV